MNCINPDVGFSSEKLGVCAWNLQLITVRSVSTVGAYGRWDARTMLIHVHADHRL